ncbi:MAG: SDR family oxidoreductase [Burkholderiales bacterium]|nr:SDR family oxidoreductase [Burkholderiales bacterium]
MFQTDLFKGHKILVTGGGTGLGRAMSERLLQLGAHLVICGRRKGVLDATAAELVGRHGGTVDTHACDVRDSAAVEDMMEQIFARGPLTGLINNAAGNFISRTEDLSPRGFDAVADTVMHGTFYVTQAVGRRWIAAGSKGSVLSIIVTWVWTGSPFVVPSAMSKAGIDVMTKSLAVEWGRYGIRLNAIAPGIFPTEGAGARLRPGVRTHEREIAENPMRRLGQMDELTDLAAFLMAPNCEWLTGQTIAIDGANWLANGAYFKQYMDWTDEQWADARARIKEQNDRDKAQRST